MSSTPLLDITNLQIAASNGNILLNDVSLTLDAGEVAGLIGESGAGKSTLGLAAAGHVRAGCRVAGGSVRFAGTDLLATAPHGRNTLLGTHIAYVAQSASASFNPARKLWRQVAEPLLVHERAKRVDARARVDALFEELDLPQPHTFGDKYPHQVSGGQLQRAMLAMALICEPELVIFDEPTTALDATTQIEVLAAIRAALARHGTAAIYISHDLAIVAQLATRIMVLRHGRVIETGDTRKLIDAPRVAYTRELLDALSAPAHSPRADSPPTGNVEASPGLIVSDVSASYRDRAGVLNDVSLILKAGETLAVVGASGSGKSTLARAICGLLPPVSGNITLDGVPLAARFQDRTRETLRKVQLVYQSPQAALNPHHKVGEILARVVNLHFGGTRADAGRRVNELLEMVGLPVTVATRQPAQLSGGQIQRIGIARALAARPEFMICDEVTSALDPIVAVGVLDLLKQLQLDTGLGILFITHDMTVVRRIADEIAVMHAGEFIEHGPARKILACPQHAITQRLLASTPEMREGWLTDVLAQRSAEGHLRSDSSIASHPSVRQQPLASEPFHN